MVTRVHFRRSKKPFETKRKMGVLRPKQCSAVGPVGIGRDSAALVKASPRGVDNLIENGAQKCSQVRSSRPHVFFACTEVQFRKIPSVLDTPCLFLKVPRSAYLWISLKASGMQD